MYSISAEIKVISFFPKKYSPMAKLSLPRNAPWLYWGETVATPNIQIHIKELLHKLHILCRFVAMVLFYKHSLIISAHYTPRTHENRVTR